MVQHDKHNRLFSLAAGFIEHTSRPVFLTGRAGTGKTTFLKYIREKTLKQIAVVAPTGVAAINAGGSTIHSFFQLPFTPYIPARKGFTNAGESVDTHHLLGRIRMNKERRKVLQQLELLVIDEISMVRCDVLNAIDTVLRYFRQRHHEPFGGVQVLFIGDMYQLPPVVHEEEWKILSPFYNGPFFFDSKVLQEERPVYIELNKIYRQNEEQFIDLLNKVRNNEMDEEAFALLNSRYDPLFESSKKEGYIILTTHNHKADTINTEALGRLYEKAATYKAVITGEFNEKSYPAEELLQLKTGAQIMMIKNDVEKRFYNGRIGIITDLQKDAIHVQFEQETAIEIKKEKWQNIRYTIDEQSQRIVEDEIGTFEQFPLRLAWAITIHKSQGLTFERAVIDAGAAFAAGQVYVALSRCTTLSGIVLKSRITNSGLFSDERIVAFSQQKMAEAFLTSSFDASKKAYQSQLLQSVFELTNPILACDELAKYTVSNKEAFNSDAGTWVDQLKQNLQHIQTVAGKFQTQLESLLAADNMPEEHTPLQERLKAAAVYFIKQLRQIQEYIHGCTTVTDSKQKAMVYNMMLQELYGTLSQKLHEIKGLENGFYAEQFHKHRKSFVLQQLKINVYAVSGKSYKAETPHPYLYQQLRLLRDKICAQKDVPVYFVASGATLEELCKYLPQTIEELGKISGFGKAKLGSYGQQFLDVINEYSKERNLVSMMQEKAPKPERKEKTSVPKEKTDTKQETYTLYQAGKTIEEIAGERNLSPATIEGHLAHFVAKGIIAVESLVSREKIILIEPVVQGTENALSFSAIKQQLGNEVSYAEIRFVNASLQYLKNSASMEGEL